MLIQQLRELERDGIVLRTIYPQIPPRVEYRLTKDGIALRPALRALLAWAELREKGDSSFVIVIPYLDLPLS
jgi:DNA-binding HxlR family transcriptional regulator